MSIRKMIVSSVISPRDMRRFRFRLSLQWIWVRTHLPSCEFLSCRKIDLAANKVGEFHDVESESGDERPRIAAEIRLIATACDGDETGGFDSDIKIGRLIDLGMSNVFLIGLIS